MARAGEPSRPGLPAPLRGRLAELCDTVVPRGPPRAASALDRAGASDLGVDRTIARFFSEQAADEDRAGFERFLRAVDRRGINLLVGAGAVRWSRLDAAGRERLLWRWSTSRAASARQGFAAIKRLSTFLYYAGDPTDPAPNPVWTDIGYRPSPIVAPAPTAGLVAFDPGTSPRLETDVVVVGSGAGGASVAAHLARRGHRVVVLEAGPFRRPAEFTGREAEAYANLFAGHGMLSTRDLSIAILAGRTAGGSTTVNWMTCLPPPERVRAEWATDWGIPGLDGPEYASRLADIRQRLDVGTSESHVNPSNDVLRRGCERLGYREGPDFAVIERNAAGCASRCGPCVFGCPFNAKRSALVTYLADAVASGARLVCDTEAVAVEVESGRVRGVRAVRRLGGVERELQVEAREVVLSGGALETPRLLLRSGLGGARVGRGLHLHPTTALYGEFAGPVEMWNGPMQSIVVRRFQSDDSGHGPWVESAPAHPGLAALGVPWTSGIAHKERMRRIAFAAASIALVRDVGEGRVRLARSGAVRLDYRLTDRDRRNLVRGIVETGRIHRAAGAVRIASLHQRIAEVGDGQHPVTEAEFDAFAQRVDELGVRANDLLLFSAHPTGGAAIGSDPSRTVAAPNGAVRGVAGLWIGDGSALPTAPGVNPMLSILLVARGTADAVDRHLRGGTAA